jgi:hypothetical protein
VESEVKESFNKALVEHKECKKRLEQLKVARGKPESSIITDVELTLNKNYIIRAAYHGGDFNGVCCRRIVQSAKALCDEIRTIFISKRDKSCEEKTINEKIDKVEKTLGLLDAAFAYLNTMHPTEKEKLQAREAVSTLMNFWREQTGLSVSLKGHVMEKHVCNFNDASGIGDKEESFIEQGHQLGIKDDRRYFGMTNFEKRTESTLRARSVYSHPLVQENQVKVLESSKRKRLRPNGEEDATKTKSQIKREDLKEEKKMKREHYVSINKTGE